jgi:AraC-like DNA-binding protein
VPQLKNHIVSYNDLTIFYTNGVSKKIHSNHCVKIIVGNMPLTISSERKKITSKGILIKSDTSHKVTSDEGLIVSIFIDPECEIGKAINSLFKQGRILKLENEISDKLFDLTNNSADQHLTEVDIKKHLTKVLVGIQLLDIEDFIDERILKVVNKIRSASNFTVRFKDLMESCALSESRLIHLFKKETGITIRKYVLWCRSQKALRAMTSGGSIKQAAKTAGFTDAAHLTRTFVTMYGIAPSRMLKG